MTIVEKNIRYYSYKIITVISSTEKFQNSLYSLYYILENLNENISTAITDFNLSHFSL